MEEVRKKLTPQERAILSDLYEDKDKFRSLQSALSHRQLWLAQFSALTATGMDQVMESRGKIAEDNWVIAFLKFNFTEGENARKLAEKAKVSEDQ